MGAPWEPFGFIFEGHGGSWGRLGSHLASPDSQDDEIIEICVTPGMPKVKKSMVFTYANAHSQLCDFCLKKYDISKSAVLPRREHHF